VESFVDGVRKLLALEPEGLHFYLFLPSHSTAFSKMGRRLTQAELRNAHKMLEAARPLLMGYREIAKGVYLQEGLDERHTNLQSIHELGERSSTLGLGAIASSRIYAACAYMNPGYEDYVLGKGRYRGVVMDKTDEKVRFITDNFDQGVDLVRYKRLFGTNMEDDFWSEVRFLEANNLCRRKVGRLVFTGKRDVAERIFYPSDRLKQLYGNLSQKVQNGTS
jgi:coproporphyrinogen III oxidase-like Fe-S oxidoreductase